ncbi:hypothetical protein [Yoonia sp. MH D7]
MSYNELGSCFIMGPLPATSFVTGSGGGWIVNGWVMMDRSRV